MNLRNRTTGSAWAAFLGVLTINFAMPGTMLAQSAGVVPAAVAGDTPDVAPLTAPSTMTTSAVKPAVYVAPIGPNKDTTLLQQAGCVGCDGGLFPSNVPVNGAGPGIYGYGRRGGGDSTCNLGCTDAGCGENGCVPGRAPCTTCVGCGPVTRLACAFRNAFNCPDPCYEPKWIAAQNASIFLESARPLTQTRFRWDAGRNMNTPDRAQFFWSNNVPETRLDYHTLNMYTEAGTDKFSMFVNLQYRSVTGQLTGGAGGFGDMSVGTKSVLVDSELTLLTFQFTTFIPTGTATSTGNGHVSLEPALLSSIKLYTDTYWQSQLGYWIPIAAPGGRSGGVVEWHNSLNHTLFRPLPDMSIIGTIETTGYTFTAGAVTLPGNPAASAQGTYFNMGPGIRFAFSDKLDFGFGMQFALTNQRGPDQLYRTELRWRF